MKRLPESSRASRAGGLTPAARRRRSQRDSRANQPAPAGRARPADAKAFPIVGPGASAGGLEAVTELLRALPPNPGMAFVVMQHLDPTHESALPALLGRATNLSVAEARHNLRLEPNRVYVIPPNKAIRVADGRLKVTPRKTEKEVRMPIDQFLESLAKEEADRAVGVVLSGNRSDGTRGLLAVKAAGGITFAQDDKSAKYTAMPANAVAAGCVDFVLPPGRIAKELVTLAGRPPGAEVPLLPSTSKARGEERAFEEILALLRQRVGVDFTYYKRPTLDRRIRRRMALRRLDTLRHYADYLRNHPAEVQELFNDILIHVTGFSRDKAVFATLRKKILPRLIQGRATEEPTNEELRSANEESLSSNEKLQSTNEELETAKEELQSTNEELTTLNDELESRNTELMRVDNDFHNLMASVSIPIVMVGPDLRIRRFTDIAQKLLNLIPADLGRPITDIKTKLDLPRLGRLIGEVIDTLQTRDIEVQDQNGHWWSVRIRPYKTTDQKIDGAVIAFLDVDLLKKSPHDPSHT
jgi:hypothetical protein